MGSNYFGKCLAGMNSAYTSTKQAFANAKEDGKAAESEKTISLLIAEIGNLTLLQLDEGRGDVKANRQIMERYEAICSAREAVQAAENAKRHKWRKGPHCGAKSLMGFEYCGKCGSKLL